MESISVANILPTTSVSPSAGASAIVQATAGAASGQGPNVALGAHGAFSDLLAKQIALAIPQLLESVQKDSSNLIANDASTSTIPGIDPTQLIQQINIDINQILSGQPQGTENLAKDVQKLLAEDPALAGALKKIKKSGLEDLSSLNPAELQSIQQLVALTIPFGNLPPTLAATTAVTGKDLPKDMTVQTKLPTSAASSVIQSDTVASKEDKSLAAFAVELATKLAAAAKPESIAAQTQETQQTQQQVPLNVISSATTVNAINSNSLEVAPTVGSPNWDTALGDKVVWIVGAQTQNAELHLNPPSLGPLEIRVSMSDGQANLSFMTQHAAVREAIEAATPKLREMMGDNGINMGSMSVNVGTFAQQQQDQAAQQQAANNRNNASGNDAFFGMGTDSTPADVVTTTVQPLRDLGMVDLFA
jgi:flagellar hook-length control protein FliK